MLALAAERLAAPLFGALISLIVIRRTSTAVWGQVVAPMVVVQLAAHLVGWGNKEFLLREFSRSPARIARSWQTSAISRLALFVLLLPGMLLVPSPPHLWWLAGFWCLGIAASQSLESLVLFRKDFRFALVVEVTAGLLVLTAAGWPGSLPTVDRLLVWFAVAAWLRFAALIVRHRDVTLVRSDSRFDAGYFRQALPFFLLGLTGLLQSRADLYAATWMLAADSLGVYQTLTTMFLLLQSSALFALGPYARLLYRLRHDTIVRISRRLFVLGVAVTACGLGAIHFVLERLYRVPAGVGLLLLGAAIVLPCFYYVPVVYELFQLRRQSAVVWVNAAGALVSFALGLLLLPGLGVAGALIGAAAAQGLMLAVYVGLVRSSRRREAGRIRE